MMFIAMLIVILVIILLVIGVISFLTNIVLTIIFHKYGKKNKVCYVLKRITPFLCIGSLILMIPFGLLAGWFIYKYSKVPKEYVECETTIQFEKEFDSFISSTGDQYVNLFYELNYHSENNLTPVYSYKPKGLFNKNEWRNVFEIETEHDFSLYTISYDSQGWQYGIYALKEEEDVIKQYYQNNKYWILSNGINRMSLAMSNLIDKYEKKENADLILTEEEYISFKIEACSLDEHLIVDECVFFFQNDRVFVSPYYIIDGYYKYYGFELEGEEKLLAESEINSNLKK